MGGLWSRGCRRTVKRLLLRGYHPGCHWTSEIRIRLGRGMRRGFSGNQWSISLWESFKMLGWNWEEISPLYWGYPDFLPAVHWRLRTGYGSWEGQVCFRIRWSRTWEWIWGHKGASWGRVWRVMTHVILNIEEVVSTEFMSWLDQTA